MRTPRILDLFCCAGGAAAGYDAAGFDVHGVDIAEQPHFPYSMTVADVMTLPRSYLREFDAIHASPPCQAYSDLAHRNGNADSWPRLIEPVREMLEATGRPYVIENVEGAPLRNYVVLCGTMFPSLRVIRHRLFEANFPIPEPAHMPHPLCHTLDKRKAHYGKTNEWIDYVSVNGGGNCSIAAARDAMGIPWMTKKEINEAIPPAYTEYVGTLLMEYLGMAKKKSVKEQLGQFFLEHKGEVVNAQQLQEVASGRTEWARRVRELRSDYGWPIQTQNDASDLKQGEYRLTGDPPAPGTYDFSPRVSQTQRFRILERNGFTCQACGAGAGEMDSEGRPVRLHVDHHEAYSHGGSISDSNLRVLCSACNQGAKNITAQPPHWSLLMTHLRRASRDDQIRALKWLKDKFE